MIQRFFAGFGFIISGWRLLGKVQGLVPWLLFPYLIAVALLGLGVYFGSEFISPIVHKAMLFTFASAEGIFYQLLYYPLLIIFWLVFIVLYFYVVYVLTSVVASPFYAIVAEKTLRHLKAIEERPFSLRQTLGVSLRMFGVSLVRGSLLLFIGVFLFVVSFVPALNLLAGYAVFVLLAFDSMDYAFEASAYGLRQRLRFFRDNLPEFLGMGGFVALTSFIPGLILMVMPLAVVGSAELLSQIKERHKKMDKK